MGHREDEANAAAEYHVPQRRRTKEDRRTREALVLGCFDLGTGSSSGLYQLLKRKCKLIIVVDAPDAGALGALLTAMSQLAHVHAASLVFHAIDVG